MYVLVCVWLFMKLYMLLYIFYALWPESIWTAVHFFPQNNAIFGSSDSIKAVNINRCSS